MDIEKITTALQDINVDTDFISKTLKVASLISKHFHDNNVELVVVGRAAIGMLTNGAPPGNDLDFCLITPHILSPRKRQTLMSDLGAVGGPRGWKLAGIPVTIHGLVESFSRTPFKQIKAPYGDVLVMKPEDLLVERILVSVFPSANDGSSSSVRSIIVAALNNNLAIDWQEVLRLASLPEYNIRNECESIIKDIANQLGLRSPI